MFVKSGIGNLETGEIASLSVEKCDSVDLIVTLFEIPEDEVCSACRRYAAIKLP